MAKVTISEKYFLELVNKKSKEIENLRQSELRAWNLFHESNDEKKEFWQELQTLRAVQKEYDELKSKPTLFSNVSVEEIIGNYLEEKFEGSVVIDGKHQPILGFQNVTSIDSESRRYSFRMALVVLPGYWQDAFTEKRFPEAKKPTGEENPGGDVIWTKDNNDSTQLHVSSIPTQDTDGADDIPSTVGGRPATDILPHENYDW
jgi:hypothetical protein